jgi:ABC-type sulfate transport system permease component
MLEAIGIFLLYTLIGAAVGIIIGFAAFLVVEMRDSIRELKHTQKHTQE